MTLMIIVINLEEEEKKGNERIEISIHTVSAIVGYEIMNKRRL